MWCCFGHFTCQGCFVFLPGKILTFRTGHVFEWEYKIFEEHSKIQAQSLAAMYRISARKKLHWTLQVRIENRINRNRKSAKSNKNERKPILTLTITSTLPALTVMIFRTLNSKHRQKDQIPQEWSPIQKPIVRGGGNRSEVIEARDRRRCFHRAYCSRLAESMNQDSKFADITSKHQAMKENTNLNASQQMPGTAVKEDRDRGASYSLSALAEAAIADENCGTTHTSSPKQKELVICTWPVTMGAKMDTPTRV